VFHAPLAWQDSAEIEVVTTEADERGFTQEFAVRSAASGAAIATFVHRWAWVDTNTGRRVSLSDEDRAKLVAG
jgi:acyl-CoA thioesterase FadM